MRIALAVVAIAAVPTGTAVIPARAAARGSPPVAVSASYDLPPDYFRPGACGFPIRVELSGKAGTIALPGGRFIFTSPGVTVTVTNLDDPTKLVTLVATGAFHLLAPHPRTRHPERLRPPSSSYAQDHRAARTSWKIPAQQRRF